MTPTLLPVERFVVESTLLDQIEVFCILNTGTMKK